MAQNPFVERPTARSSSVLLFDVSKEIRSCGGSIWLVQPLDYGTIFRASIGKKTCRVIVPRLGETIKAIPDEPNSHSHIVQGIDELREWLSAL